MSHGACGSCGCAWEECECSRGDVPAAPQPSQAKTFSAHGTYIETYECFGMRNKVTRAQAFDLLSKSPYIKRKLSVGESRDGQFLMDRGWAIVDISRDLGYVDAVYNFNGRYSVRRASLAGFLTFLREVIETRSPLRHLYFDLTEPHDHA